MFRALPATDNCRDIFDRGRHLLLGISPFNSRFSDDYISRLIAWARRTCDRFDVLLAGNEAAFLLEAVGTPPGQARRKARKAVARNRRAVEAALAAERVPAAADRVHTFSDYQDDQAYRQLRTEVVDAFRRHGSFRGACLEMSRRAVGSRLRSVHATCAPVADERISLAANYVTAELPFFLNTPAILQVKESLLVYHRPWPLGARIFAGEFPIEVSERQGYLTVSEEM